MTYDLSDFATSTKPTKSYTNTANGEKMIVKNRGTIEISPTLKLSNCLYVPALSHKLLSISHVTKELNCSVLIQPTFCILQDIRTGAIIGRGTKIKGLYYVDEVTQNGVVMLSHGTVKREAWLWHRRLGHPSNGYLHVLFPKLFPSNRYVLPPRANRGVPPKRYSPEKVSRESRYPMANIAKGNLSKEAKDFVASVYSDEIPANTEQALKSRKWKKVMKEEMEALTKNNTWEKCICHLERKLSGVVSKINTIRVLCSLAAKTGWPLHQFDVKNDFLHGELKEEVYMESPHGFTNKFGEREVCILRKSLYGLKQSPRAWLGRQHGRMILESIENAPLIWRTIEENGVTTPRKYPELSATDAIQVDCDIKATYIILQGLPPEIYALVSNHRIAKELWERI
nr:putative ribonuclease H-like domain-containing protein [Tanacetum cinerariifolium]